MDGDLLVDWPESYLDPYDSTRNNDPFVDCGDIQFGMPYSPLAIDTADIMGIVQSMPDNLLYEAHFSNPAYAYASDVLYIPSDNTSINQRQQANPRLHIITRLSPDRINEPESSTASSSSLSQLLPTPSLQVYPSFQSPVQVPSPQSASAVSGIVIPDLEKMSPPPVSSAFPFDEEIFNVPTSSLAAETDIVTQSPMPHIVEWKRAIELCGTNDFVPQTVYQPYTEADKKRYIRDVQLQETIFFYSHGSCEWGISLEDALKQKLRNLKDKDDLMFIGCGPSVSIRIQWPGYPAWSKQIPTMDFKTPKGPITRAKLAKNIATCIRRFAASVQGKPMEAESDRRWKIGSQYIKVEDLILVSLHHVSKGSWQPQLRLRYSINTFPPHRHRFLPPARTS